MVQYMNSKLCCMNFLQVEDYRNSSMIECKMGISADTLVLIHSSSKVSCTTFSNLVLSMFLLTVNVEMSFMQVISLKKYRKILKISPGPYIFQKPFLRGLFLEGLIFGGAYLRREICVSKSIGLTLQLIIFALFYFVFEGNFPSTSPQGLIFGGAI